MSSFLSQLSPRAQPALSPLVGERWREGCETNRNLSIHPSLTLPHKEGGNNEPLRA
jgi:hypothetical protein